FGWRCGVILSCGPGALAYCFSRAPSDSPISGIRAVVQLDREA
ncbi:hypothetical protein A2U01_0015668, partial [Trifolium medium]|nr:hypothetical protein [Trifolium medium]